MEAYLSDSECDIICAWFTIIACLDGIIIIIQNWKIKYISKGESHSNILTIFSSNSNE